MRIVNKEDYDSVFRYCINTGDLVSIKYIPTKNILGLLTTVFLPKDSPSHTAIAYVDRNRNIVMVAEQIGCGNVMSRLSQYTAKLGHSVAWIDVRPPPKGVVVTKGNILEALKTKTHYSLLQFISAGLERMSKGYISLPLSNNSLICSMFVYKLYAKRGWKPKHPLKVVDPREMMDAIRVN